MIASVFKFVIGDIEKYKMGNCALKNQYLPCSLNVCPAVQRSEGVEL
jgi:hypothetical protein